MYGFCSSFRHSLISTSSHSFYRVQGTCICKQFRFFFLVLLFFVVCLVLTEIFVHSYNRWKKKVAVTDLWPLSLCFYLIFFSFLICFPYRFVKRIFHHVRNNKKSDQRFENQRIQMETNIRHRLIQHHLHHHHPVTKIKSMVDQVKIVTPTALPESVNS